jgi:hypothetical protein
MVDKPRTCFPTCSQVLMPAFMPALGIGFHCYFTALSTASVKQLAPRNDRRRLCQVRITGKLASYKLRPHVVRYVGYFDNVRNRIGSPRRLVWAYLADTENARSHLSYQKICLSHLSVRPITSLKFAQSRPSCRPAVLIARLPWFPAPMVPHYHAARLFRRPRYHATTIS